MKRSVIVSALMSFALLGCNEDPLFDPVSPDSDDVFDQFEPGFHTLFGRPSDKTGIEEGCCMPKCLFQENDGSSSIWQAPLYTQEDMISLYEDWVLVEPWPVFGGNEFDQPITPESPDVFTLCAVYPRPDARQGDSGAMPYELRTYRGNDEPAARAAAQEDGAMVTHRGPCGACSSLANLAIYIANPDLTDPVRSCGIGGLFDRRLSRLACIASLGFDLPCAQAWDFTTQSTLEACLPICGRRDNRRGNHNKPYECVPDGPAPEDLKSLNDCLACDELFSGDLFKAAAGRSRRGSGLPSAICRRCDGVFRVRHDEYTYPEE